MLASRDFSEHSRPVRSRASSNDDDDAADDSHMRLSFPDPLSSVETIEADDTTAYSFLLDAAPPSPKSTAPSAATEALLSDGDVDGESNDRELETGERRLRAKDGDENKVKAIADWLKSAGESAIKATSARQIETASGEKGRSPQTASLSASPAPLSASNGDVERNGPISLNDNDSGKDGSPRSLLSATVHDNASTDSPLTETLDSIAAASATSSRSCSLLSLVLIGLSAVCAITAIAMGDKGRSPLASNVVMPTRSSTSASSSSYSIASVIASTSVLSVPSAAPQPRIEAVQYNSSPIQALAVIESVVVASKSSANVHAARNRSSDTVAAVNVDILVDPRRRRKHTHGGRAHRSAGPCGRKIRQSAPVSRSTPPLSWPFDLAAPLALPPSLQTAPDLKAQLKQLRRRLRRAETVLGPIQGQLRQHTLSLARQLEDTSRHRLRDLLRLSTRAETRARGLGHQLRQRSQAASRYIRHSARDRLAPLKTITTRDRVQALQHLSKRAEFRARKVTSKWSSKGAKLMQDATRKAKRHVARAATALDAIKNGEVNLDFKVGQNCVRVKRCSELEGQASHACRQRRVKAPKHR